MAVVLVHIDLDGDRPHPSSLAALAAGRAVASSWGATLYAAVVVCDEADRAKVDAPARIVRGDSIPGIASESIRGALARAGTDKVVIALCEVEPSPLWATVGNAWQGVLDHLRPRLVAFGADAPSAAELGPRTGARIGARLLMRARAIGVDEVELRDHEGRHARVGDGGAAVVLVGGSVAGAPDHDDDAADDDDIDVVMLVVPGGADSRVELAGRVPAAAGQRLAPIVALGDDAAGDDAIVKRARELAALLDAELVGEAGAARAVATDAVLDPGAAIAPELCVAIGGPTFDLAGSAISIRIGSDGKGVDGALAGMIGPNLDELVRRLEHA